MEGVSNSKPKDRIPLSEKDNDDWKKRLFLYYDERCTELINPRKARACYDLVSGHYDESEYNYLTNPLRSTRPEMSSYPAKMKNYPIIPPVFQMLMSEKREMLTVPVVLAKNTDIDLVRNMVRTNLINKNLQLQFLNFYNAIESGGQMEPEQVQSMEEILAQVKKIPDLKSKLGHNIIENIIKDNDIFMKIMLAFYYYLAVGKAVTYKDLFNKELFYTIIPPENVRWVKSPDTIMLEDSQAVIVEHYKSVNELYDMFQNHKEFESSGLKEFLDSNEANDLSNNEADFHNEKQSLNKLFSNLFKADVINNETSGAYNTGSGIRLEHLNCRSQQKIGMLVKQMPDGTIKEFEVDERYEALPNEEISWNYKDQIFEGFRINSKIYIGIEPYTLAEYKKSKGKFCYNGRSQLSVSTDYISFAELSEPYQKSYNITKYKIEHTIAKNLDSLVVIPLGLIPDDEDWDEQKLIYYMQALSILFIDETNENAAQALNALKSFNLSMWQYIVQAHQLLEDIVRQYHESVGISPQRMSNITQSAGKGTTNQAIYRSSLISLEMFTEFEEFEQRDYQGLLRLGKYTISAGEKRMYIKLNGKTDIIDTTNFEDFYDFDFDVHVSNSKIEKEKRELLKQQLQAFAQNQGSPKQIAAIINADNNYGELIEQLDIMEQELLQRSQSAVKAEQDAEERKYQHEIEIENIKAGVEMYKVNAQQARENLEESGVDVNKLKNDLDNIVSNIQSSSETQDKIDERARQKEEDVLKREEFKTKLKNKVVGEK